MNFHIITIFPESFNSYFNTSILKKAIQSKYINIFYYKLNDFSLLKTKRVDKKAFGLKGQVISPEPLAKAIEFINNKIGKKSPVIYFSPSGDLYHQEKSEYFIEKNYSDLIIICGHYEGIDERIIELYVDYKISIGEYILSSGELPAMVFIDSIARQIDGVLGNKNSFLEESFSKKLNRQKEYPVYTRPRLFKGKKVPDILISGNFGEIEKWKKSNLS